MTNTIDEKIEELVEWNRKYPNAQVSYSRIPLDILKEYITSKVDYEKLVEEYRKMQKNYEYVRIRRSQGKLTEEQEQRCIEGNVRGVFGYPTEISELAKKYRINKDKIVYITSKYQTMENFIEVYQNEKLEIEDIMVLKNNLRSNIDIRLKNNNNYDKLIKKIMEKSYITSSSLNFYDSDKIEKAIQQLKPKEEELLRKRYGLDDGVPKTLKEIAKEYNVSRARINGIETIILRQLRKPNKRRTFIKEEWNNVCFTTKYEEKIINQIKENIFNSNMIFYPDKEYQQIENDIDIDYFNECIQALEIIEQERQSINTNEDITKLDLKESVEKKLRLIGIEKVGQLVRISEEDLKKHDLLTIKEFKEVRDKIKQYSIVIEQSNQSENDINIVELGLSHRTFNCLKRAGINTLGDLRRLQDEGIKAINNIGSKCFEEIKNKMNEYEGTKTLQEQSELEKIKNERNNLKEEVADLRKKAYESKKLLNSYEEIINNDKNEKNK